MKIKVLLVFCILLFACTNNEQKEIVEEETVKEESVQEVQEVEERIMQLKIDEIEVEVDWEDNEAVKALNELVNDKELVIDMSMYGGFEQVGDIGVNLPNNDTQLTTEAGDIVLYSSDQLVIFYGSNSWSYTKLGHIKDKNVEELKELLGKSDVQVTLYLD